MFSFPSLQVHNSNMIKILLRDFGQCLRVVSQGSLWRIFKPLHKKMLSSEENTVLEVYHILFANTVFSVKYFLEQVPNSPSFIEEILRNFTFKNKANITEIIF